MLSDRPVKYELFSFFPLDRFPKSTYTHWNKNIPDFHGSHDLKRTIGIALNLAVF